MGEEEEEADKAHGDGPPYIVETPLPDVKKEMEGLQEDKGGGEQRGLSVQGQVSRLPAVHVHRILCRFPSQLSFTSCLALYTLPPVRPLFVRDLLGGLYHLVFVPEMLRSCRGGGRQMIFANVCVELKLCLIVKSKECTSDSRYTRIFMHTHASEDDKWDDSGDLEPVETL